MLKKFFLFLLCFNIIIITNAQSILEPYNSEIYTKEENNGYLKANVGANFQFFDNPFFKLKTNKYSNFVFTTNSPKLFTLELAFPKEIIPNNKLIVGLYYSEADMSCLLDASTSSKFGSISNDFAGIFSMDGRLMYAGFGLGLHRENSIYRRINIELSSILTFGTYFMDNDLKDTSVSNLDDRNSPLISGNLMVHIPPKIYYKFNAQLKNTIDISYNASKSFRILMGFTYNLGLPNKVFERSFYIYNSSNLQTPVSYEKAVFSNSSMNFHLGLGVVM